MPLLVLSRGVGWFSLLSSHSCYVQLSIVCLVAAVEGFNVSSRHASPGAFLVVFELASQGPNFLLRS